MASATQARNTSAVVGIYLVLPVKKGATIYAGTLVAIDETGHAIPAEKTTEIIAAGRAEHTVDNIKGQDGDSFVKVARGIFKWDNSATNPIKPEHVLKPCYIEDDCTVASLETGSSVAGIVLRIDSDGQIIVETR